jgi:hypothetical protein
MPMPKLISRDLKTHGARRGDEQFPVDPEITLVSFDTPLSGGDLLRMVVMSDHATAHYSAMHEHHHGNPAVSIDDLTSFTLRANPLTSGQESDIVTFVGSLSLSFSVPQVASWTRGTYTPTAARKRLYKATDLDDTTRLIGVLLEQDTNGRLRQVVWYKTQQGPMIFQSTPGALSFDLVLDRHGAPSTDPSDIGGWTWYYCPSV